MMSLFFAGKKFTSAISAFPIWLSMSLEMVNAREFPTVINFCNIFTLSLSKDYNHVITKFAVCQEGKYFGVNMISVRMLIWRRDFIGWRFPLFRRLGRQNLENCLRNLKPQNPPGRL